MTPPRPVVHVRREAFAQYQRLRDLFRETAQGPALAGGRPAAGAERRAAKGNR